MSSLMKKMLSPSKGSGLIKESSVLSKSKLLNEKDEICTGIPMLNVALSGSISGGLTAGVTTIAAPSKHFKSNISLVLMKAYMDEYPDSVCLFYDSEFGSTKDYFSSLDIDPERIIHIPIENIEDFKFDLAHRLNEQIVRGDKVFIYVDSIGNLASKKELEDANDAKSVTDMTRAKALKALFRIVTPQLTIRDIPMVCIAHVYDTQEMYSKKIVSGGTGLVYSSNTIWQIGKRQIKEGKEVIGYDFMINIDKSRYLKEKAVIPLNVTYSGGINVWGGLMDVAILGGFVTKPSNGWYIRPHIKDDKKSRLNDTNCENFWKPVLEDTEFPEFIERVYKLATTKLIQEDVDETDKPIDFDPETGELLEDK